MNLIYNLISSNLYIQRKKRKIVIITTTKTAKKIQLSTMTAIREKVLNLL